MRSFAVIASILLVTAVQADVPPPDGYPFAFDIIGPVRLDGTPSRQFTVKWYGAGWGLPFDDDPTLAFFMNYPIDASSNNEYFYDERFTDIPNESECLGNVFYENSGIRFVGDKGDQFTALLPEPVLITCIMPLLWFRRRRR